MSYTRSQILSNVHGDTFGSVITQVLSMLMKKHIGSVSHVVFDSYLGLSLKGMERDKRGKHGVIHLARIDHNTPIPQQMNKFWTSNKNNVLLQKLASTVLLDLGEKTGVMVVSSGVVDDFPTPATIFSSDDGSCFVIPELELNYEEADCRLIPHIHWNVLSFPSCDCAVTISNDTDVLVLLIHYFQEWNQDGLQQLWFEIGTGASKSLIPVHILCSRLVGKNVLL